MGTLGYEQMMAAKAAVKTLYTLGLIGLFVCDELLQKIDRHTGE